MKKFIAVFEVPDDYKPKRFKASDNVDGWFYNSLGHLISVPSSLKEIKKGEETDERKN